MASKKLMSGLVAAATLIATPAVGMIAAGSAMADTPATITMSGAVDGHTFTAYKIADYGNVTITDGKAELTLSGTDADNIKTAVEAAGITVADGQDPIDAVARNATATQVKAFAAKLATLNLTPTGDTVTGADGSAVLNVTEGWYLITDSQGLPVLAGTTVTSNGQTATQLKGGQTLGTVDVKSTSLSVDKKVGGLDNGSASVGDTIEYTVTIPMPDPANIATLTFKDTLTGGAITGTPSATLDGAATTINPVMSENNSGFTLDLTGLLAGNKDKTLVLTYQVKTSAKTVSNDAQLSGTDTDGNNVTPDNGGGEDTVEVKAYDFDLTKVDSVDTSTTLSDAKFKIRKTDGKWLKQDAQGLWSEADGEEDATEFTTGVDGKTTFTGLGNGSYTVKETSAPEDHYLAGEFTFTAVVKDGKTTFSGNLLVSQADDDSAQVKNNPTISGLAKTGAGGLVLAGGVASIMAVIGVGCAFAYKRQQAKV